MDAFQKRLESHNKNNAAIEYARNLERVSLNTTWFETKTKYDPIYRTRVETKKMEQKNEVALQQIKIIRNRKLTDLYTQEADQWSQELLSMGLAIRKDRY